MASPEQLKKQEDSNPKFSRPRFTVTQWIRMNWAVKKLGSSQGSRELLDLLDKCGLTVVPLLSKQSERDAPLLRRQLQVVKRRVMIHTERERRERKERHQVEDDLEEERRRSIKLAGMLTLIRESIKGQENHRNSKGLSVETETGWDESELDKLKEELEAAKRMEKDKEEERLKRMTELEDLKDAQKRLMREQQRTKMFMMRVSDILGMEENTDELISAGWEQGVGKMVKKIEELKEMLNLTQNLLSDVLTQQLEEEPIGEPATTSLIANANHNERTSTITPINSLREGGSNASSAIFASSPPPNLGSFTNEAIASHVRFTREIFTGLTNRTGSNTSFLATANSPVTPVALSVALNSLKGPCKSPGCSQSFLSSEEMEKHMLDCGSCLQSKSVDKEESQTGDSASSGIRKLKRRRMHQQKKHMPRFFCACGRRFISFTNLSRHINYFERDRQMGRTTVAMRNARRELNTQHEFRRR